MIIRGYVTCVAIRSQFSKSTHIRNVSFRANIIPAIMRLVQNFVTRIAVYVMFNILNTVSDRREYFSRSKLGFRSPFCRKLNGLNVTTLRPNLQDLLSYDGQRQKCVCVCRLRNSPLIEFLFAN